MIDKKEAIRQYKNTLQPMGIYRITNSVNGKIFIGSSLNVDKIFNRILFQLKHNSYGNKDLQEDFNLNGESNFSFEIIDHLEPKKDKEQGYDYTDDLQVLEGMWLDKLQPYEKIGYNSRKTIKTI